MKQTNKKINDAEAEYWTDDYINLYQPTDGDK